MPLSNVPQIIDAAWLSRSSLAVAPDLIGCWLVRLLPDGTELRGLIVETEAYAPDDPACHAYRRQTKRNAVMFGPAGYAYVYLIYGIYHCFNIVTDQDQVPSAVLIRALELATAPASVEGSAKTVHRLAAGPGKLCQVLHIDLTLSGQSLVTGGVLWLEPRSQAFQQALDQGKRHLHQTTRIGLTQGVDLPWRWYLQDSPAVSRR